MIIRASSLAELFDCPARWEAKHIDKLVIPTNYRALLGTAVHKSTAIYDYAKIKNLPVTVEETFQDAHKTIYDPDCEVDWEDISKNKIENAAILMHKKYCEEITPAQNYIGIEITCDNLEFEDLDITLTGTVDRVRKVNDGIGIVDLKTGKNIVHVDGQMHVHKHMLQLGIYELLVEKTLGIKVSQPAQIIGINSNYINDFVRIGKELLCSAKKAVLGTPESPGALQAASNILKSGLFYGNPSSFLCHKKYCPKFDKCFWRNKI